MTTLGLVKTTAVPVRKINKSWISKIYPAAFKKTVDDYWK
jgi:hypothetical protein